jgi:hypothetical protein
MLDVTVKGSEDLRRMARALRQADRVDLRRNLGKAMRRAGKPTLDAVKKSAEDIKTTGFRKPGARHPFEKVVEAHGTRRRIAEAATLDVRVEEDNPRVRFRIAEAKLPENLRSMPRHFDSGKPWRHPVLGNRNAWVSQTADPWFWPPIRDNIKTFRAEIDRALDETREMLERA